MIIPFAIEGEVESAFNNEPCNSILLLESEEGVESVGLLGFSWVASAELLNVFTAFVSLFNSVNNASSLVESFFNSSLAFANSLIKVTKAAGSFLPWFINSTSAILFFNCSFAETVAVVAWELFKSAIANLNCSL